jgi:hypothetical protein
VTAILTEADRDLLVAAHGAGPDVVPAWHRWRDGINWDGEIPGDAFPLLPMVRRTLLAQGVDDALFPRFLGIARQSWLRNQRRRASTVAWLARWPVDAVLALPPSAALFGDAARVLHGDALHLAIRSVAAEPAVEQLLQIAEVIGPVRPPRRFLLGFVRGTGHVTCAVPEVGTITVSWRLDHWLGARAEGAWRDSVPLAVGAPTLRVLSATDEVAFLLRLPVGGRPLRWAAELLATDLAAVDWESLSAALLERPLAPEATALLATLSPLRADWPLAATARVGAYAPLTSAASPVPDSALGRWRADWMRYRQAWGGAFRWRTAVSQLPGYALARWQLAAPADLPAAFLRWLRHGRTTT